MNELDAAFPDEGLLPLPESPGVLGTAQKNEPFNTSAHSNTGLLNVPTVEPLTLASDAINENRLPGATDTIDSQVIPTSDGPKDDALTGIHDGRLLADTTNDIGDVFVVSGDVGETVTLRFQWTYREAQLNNEMGIFAIDADGKVNGIAPGEAGFAQAALNSTSRQVLFSHGKQTGAWKELNFQAGDRLAFYLVQDSSTADWLVRNPKNQVDQGPMAFFSLDGVNPDGFDHVRSQSFGESIQRFAWEDLWGGGDRDFNDAVLLVSEAGVEIPGGIGQSATLTVDLLSQSARFRNEMGFFLVDDARGHIGTLKPGDQGYAAAALSRANRQVVFAREQDAGSVSQYQIPAGKFLGWYLIQDATTSDFLAQNPENQLDGGPLAFFSYPGANPDGLSHIHFQAANEMVWEDMTGGGDLDYNDLIFSYELKAPPQVADEIVLAEGSQFEVSYRESITVSDQPSTLQFTIADLAFDTTDTDAINDAFEAALVDSEGNSLVHTITGSRDAFFNWTEGETPQLANGVSQDGQTITVNLAGIAADTEATMILRLVNNDDDITTQARIRRIQTLAANVLPPTGVTPTSQTLTADLAESLIFDGIQDVSASLTVDYGFTSFNEETETLFSDFTVRNAGQYEVDKPLIMAVTNISDPTVTVLGADGLTLDGLPYYDLSNLVTGSTLTPGDKTESATLRFKNPNGSQFTYNLVFLGSLNEGPVITSEANVEGLIGKPYRYDVDATDPEGDPITYALVTAPDDMAIDPETGEIEWAPQAADRGTQSITVQATDGRGGVAEQSFDLVVGDAPPNRPPVFTTGPVVDARVNEAYEYDADATDLDYNELTYALIDGPEGMTVDPATGMVSWTPTAEQIAQDNQVADADQGFPIVDGFTLETYAEVTDPIELSFDPAGTLYVGRNTGGPTSPNRIHRITPQGTLVEEIGERAIADPDTVLFDKSGVVSGVPGAVLVGGWNGSINSIGHISAILPDGTVEVLFSSTDIGNVSSMVLDERGRLIFSTSASTSEIIAIEDGEPQVLFDVPARIGTLLVDDDQEIIYVGGDDGVIRIYSADGQLVNESFADQLGVFPVMDLGPGGAWGNDLYVADRSEAKLYRLDADGNKEVVIEGLSNNLFIADIAFGPDGALYLSDTNNDRILRIAPNRETLGLAPSEHPVTITVADGKGGVAGQNYVVNVLPEEGNHDPVIVSEPIQELRLSERLRTTEINFESFSEGSTNYPLTIEGATFTSGSEALSIIDISGFLADGTEVEGKTLHPLSGGLDSGSYTPITISFETPIAEFTAGWFDPNFSGNILRAFDINNTLLGEVPVENGPAGGIHAAPINFTRTTNEISRIEIIPSVGVDVYTIDNLVTRSYAPGGEYSYAVNAVDSDDDKLTYSLLESPVDMTIDKGTGVIRWNPVGENLPSAVVVKVRVEDDRGGSDEQEFTIQLIESPDVDLTIDEVTPSNLAVNGQTLTLTGSASAEITNQGDDNLTQPFDVLFFEDTNANQTYDQDIDTVLGSTTITAPLSAGATQTVTADLAGTVSFLGVPIWGFVDSDNAVTETDETNNLAFSSHDCIAQAISEFDPVVEWNKREFTVEPDSNQVIMTPAVIDLNRDEIPDVIFSTYTGDTYRTNGKLRAISGADGNEIWTVTNSAYEVHPETEIAVADIDNDGLPEIIAVAESESPRFGATEIAALIAFEHDGTFKWKSSAFIPRLANFNNVFASIGGPAISDLNQDGTPEIVMGATALDSEGNILWQGNFGQGSNGSGPLSTIADLDLDGTPEVIAGNTAYRADGSVYWNIPLEDGFSAIGNFDQDLNPEIVLVANWKVHLLEHTGDVKWSVDIPDTVSGFDYGGSPNIADMDGDGQPEIGVAAENKYIVFETDGTIKWASPIQDKSSATGSSAFDFDGDGSVEVVYGDELFLRIYDGANGNILYELPKSSGTGYELPIVVDVDADGNAEIVAAANQLFGDDENGIFVIGDRNDTWVSTRQIWNQHAYSINNVNDDGTIPTIPENSWQTHNTFRLNAFPEGEGNALAAPDLVSSYVRLEESGTATTITARIGNGGSQFVATGVNVAFYNGNPREGGVLLGTTQTAARLDIGAFEDVSLIVPAGSVEPDDIWVVADDDGTGRGFVNECDEENNFYNSNATQFGEIRGRKFIDSNGNGIQDREINLISNGDFSLGDVDFEADRDSLVQLDIGSNPRDFNSLATSYGDHTSGDGLMLIVNGSTSEESIVWEQTTLVSPNQDYSFNLWVSSWFPGEPGEFQLLINNEVVDSFSAPENSGVWEEFSTQWRSGEEVSAAKITILNKQIAFGGNDFSLDDITFSPESEEERGVTGVDIYLDLNNNGNLDLNEPVQTTQKDDPTTPNINETGQYSFENLLPGNYVVREVIPKGYIQTTPDTGFYAVNVESGQTVKNINFGNQFIGSAFENTDPVFISNAPTIASTNQLFRYDANAQDADGDTLTYDLSLVPEGMAVDPTSGIVVWNPTINQLGTHDVILRVQDGNGGVDLQAFQVTVGNNTAPVITSQPFGPTIANTSYTYDVDATDADGDTLTYSLLANPDGVTIDKTLGLLSWTPTDSDVGNNFIRIRVDDGQGGFDTQSFTLPVLASTAPNRPPVITNVPRDQIGLGQDYLFQIEAEDPDNDPLTYRLIEHPVGMTIDPSGLVKWPADKVQLGDYSFTVQVEDGRGAGVQATYTLTVGQQTSVNNPPEITSTPSFVATIGDQYLYEPEAIDPDNDPIVWALVSGPEGLTLNEATGRVSWTPTDDQFGFHEVIIEAIDAQGASLQQGFGINVSSTNTPPTVTSAPPTLAFSDTPYTYAIEASDPNGDALTYSLNVAPNGMTIDENTGLIEWTPTATQLGTQTVTVSVADGRGGFAEQTYTLDVASDVPNQPPKFTSKPDFGATADQAYTYQLKATDPENLTIRYELLEGPAGMDVDETTGALTWTPTLAQLGSHVVKVAAFDPLDLGASQSFNVTVRENNLAPVLNNTPDTTVLIGDTYAFDLNVTDPDGDAVTYTLVNGPEGMTIDALGRLRWTPAAEDVGTEQIDLLVEDGRGGNVTFGYDLNVIADTTAPQVALTVSADPVDVNDSVIVQVNAVDDVAINEIGLTVDGTPVALDSNGTTTLSFEAIGSVELVATALDTSGNEASTDFSLAVVDTSDVTAPLVSFIRLEDPSDPGTALIDPVTKRPFVTSFADIIGTVDDPDDNLTSFTLTATPFAGGLTTVLAEGTSEVIGDVLGEFDPTLLRNDSYILELSAVDAGGNTASTSTLVDVEGDLKVGNYTLSFVDLSIPLTGIPIVVSRTYDTLNANVSDDFGHGWSMDLRDTDLTDNVGESGLEDSGIYNAFFDGAAVYVTLPNGEREKFIFQPQARGLFGLTTYKPRFVAADGDNTSTLTVDDIDLQRTADGRYVTLSQIPYNPASTLISGTSSGNYTLTTKDGIKYTIDGDSGDLETVTDRNGNTLTYTEGGVFSSTGQQVTFERDSQGRITAVIDPEGNRITYEYDGLGDLVAVTDREGNVTRMTYEEDMPHFLDDIIDPLGRNGGRAEYDEFGRLVEIIDINGNPVKLTHNIDESKEIITDLLGNQTVLVYDSRGNVVQEVDALSGTTTRTYDERDNILTETDPLGNTTTFTYDNNNNILTETDPLGNVTTSTYNSFNQVVTTTDAVGNTLSNTFDNRGNLIRQEDAAGNVSNFTYDSKGNLATFTDAKGNETAFEYDASGNLTRLVDPIGAENKFKYNETGNLTSFTDFRGNTSTFEYDDESRVVAITDPAGNVTRTEYNALGEQTAIIDALGRRTEQRYNKRGLLTETILPDETPEDLSDNPRTIREYDAGDRLISMTDEAGRVTRYVYDELDRLVETIYPDATPDTLDDNPRMRSEYDAADRLIAEIDELGNRTEYEYDAADRLVFVRDALGNETRYTYDATDRLVETVNALGNATINQYDVLNRLTQTIDALGNVASFTYDENDNLIATTDPNGNVSQSTYDERDRLVTSTNAEGGVTNYEYDDNNNLIALTDARDNTTTFTYDNRNQLTVETDPFNNTTTYGYDPIGNLVAQTDRNNFQTTFDYDERNRLVRQIDPLSGITTNTYDATSNLVAQTDELGRITRYTYDERDRLVQTIDALNGVTTFDYDAANNLISQTDALAQTTTFTYDVLNRQDSVTDALGHTTNYAFDANGNLTSMTDALDRVTEFSYDPLDRLSITTDALGGTVTNTYDANGNLITVTDPLDRTTTFEYDGRNLQTKTIDPLGNTVTSEYDANGNLVTLTDGEGNSTTYEYDALNRQTSIIDALNSATRMTYDPEGNLLTFTDPEDNTTGYTYDALNRLTTDTNELGFSRTYTYDAVDNMIASTDRNGRDRTYTYDNLNRLVQEQWLNETDIPIETITSTYDAIGQLESITDSNSTNTFTYDAVGRLLSNDNSGTPGIPSVLLEYTYDAVGNQLSVTDTIDGITQGLESFTYDDLNRATQITQSGNGVAEKRVNMTYDAASQMESLTRYSDLASTQLVAETDYTYDDAGRLTELSHNQNGTDIATYTLAYDAANRITGITSPDGTATYDYDDISQLIEADYDFQGDEAYSYDDNGNRTNTGYDVGPNNQLISDGTYTYTYDGEGNRTSQTHIATGEVTGYTFDYRNRLTTIVTRNEDGTVTQVVENVYDAFDRRISIVVDANADGTPDSTEKFAYDGSEITLVFDGDGNLTHRYLHGTDIDQILAEETADGTVLWPLTDHLGTVRDLLNIDGTLANHITYNSFGEVTSETNPELDFRFGFTGREIDDATGLMYYRSRYYDPSTGQFISQDPLGFDAGDPNLYRYVFNSPLLATDPTGQVTLLEVAAVLAIVIIIGSLAADSVGYNPFLIEENFEPQSVAPGGYKHAITVEEFQHEIDKQIDRIDNFKGRGLPWHDLAQWFDSQYFGVNSTFKKYKITIPSETPALSKSAVMIGGEVNYYFQGLLAKEYGVSYELLLAIAEVRHLKKYGARLPENSRLMMELGYKYGEFYSLHADPDSFNRF